MDLEEPLPSDCCGSGCSPCVFDIYQQRLQSNQLRDSSSEDVLRTDLLSETRFKPFRLLKKQQIAENVFEFRFQPMTTISDNHYDEEPEIYGILPYSVGQHLFLRCKLKETCDSQIQLGQVNEMNKNSVKHIETLNECSKLSDKQIVIRAYTPITVASEEKNCCFKIFVKFYENGIASEYLNSSSVGDILYWRGPYGPYQYKPNSFSHILMLCVGSGLAPMISIINSIINNECDETIVHLKCGFKNISHIILRNDIKKMTHFWNFTVEYYLSEATKSNNSVQFGEQIKFNRLDKFSVEDYIRNKSLKDLFVLICGTECFTAEMKRITSELHILDENIHIF